MFTIYSDGVRTFEGTLERLYEVHPVERSQRPGRVEREGADAEGGAEGKDAYGVSAAVIAAYRNTAKLTIREPILHAHQVMHTPVVSVGDRAEIRDAWLRMREKRIRQMPVETAGRVLVGLLSERDVLGQLIVEKDRIRYGEARVVADVMRREVITAEPVTDVRRIARVMADSQLTAMPIVTAQQELVGIVTRGDLLRAMTRTPPLKLWT